MAIEIEKKYKLTQEDREQILANLKEQAAIFKSEDFETNEIYGGGVLNEKKAVLRVRKINGKTILTFKQRIESASGFKHQVEYETEVADAAAIEAIIENLGFEMTVIYEKRRQTWKLRNVEIVLDELPFGLFMEIEGRITDISLAETILEAEDFEVVHETYPQLTKNFGKRNGRAVEARFKKNP